MNEKVKTIPDYLLELYIHGELDPVKMSEIDREVARNSETARRIADLQAHDRTFLEKHPVHLAKATIRARASERKSQTAISWTHRLSLATGALMVTAVFLIVAFPGQWDSPDQTTGIDRVKGSAILIAFKKTKAVSQPIHNGDYAAAGDTIQLGYTANGQTYGVIMSVDGKGVITRHLPEKPGKAIDLDPMPGKLLPFSFQLDDAPMFERFFFVTAQTEFDTEIVYEALEKAAKNDDWVENTVDLPDELEQDTLLVRKPQ